MTTGRAVPGCGHKGAGICIAPSLLAADPLAIRDSVHAVAGADYLHVDVMDDRFVSGMTWGTHTVEALVAEGVSVEVHLMVADPMAWAVRFARTGCGRVTFHFEAAEDPVRIAHAVADIGSQAGLAVSPGTDLARVSPVVSEFDALLMLTVVPGNGGTTMLAESPRRCAAARRMLDAAGSAAVLGADGGVNRTTIRTLAQAGVHSFVAGTGVFHSPDPAGEITLLRRIAEESFTDHRTAGGRGA